MSPRLCIALFAMTGDSVAGSPTEWLYTRSGGAPGVANRIGRTIDHAAANARTQPGLADADLAQVRERGVAKQRPTLNR